MYLKLNNDIIYSFAEQLRKNKEWVSMVEFDILQSYALVHIYPTPSSWTACNTRSILKQNKTDSNSKFSFSEIGYFISLPYYSTRVGKGLKRWIHAFPKEISTKSNADNLI